MALGESDTLARRAEVAAFFGWRPRWPAEGHALEAASARHVSALTDPVTPESMHYFAGLRGASALPA